MIAGEAAAAKHRRRILGREIEALDAAVEVL
jgi:hypothetical protein